MSGPNTKAGLIARITELEDRLDHEREQHDLDVVEALRRRDEAFSQGVRATVKLFRRRFRDPMDWSLWYGLEEIIERVLQNAATEALALKPRREHEPRNG